jgi:deoxycytidine triphosphate deaminase
MGALNAFHEALDLVQLYTGAIIHHTQNAWTEQQTQADRIKLIKESLADLSDKELEVDKRFARGGQSSIPRSLTRRIEREFQSLQLDPTLRPVLTVGAPGTFETYIADLRGYLFHNLWDYDYPKERAYQQGRFALITVPYLEGSRAFWEPIVVGHEVGHVKVYYSNHADAHGDRAPAYLNRIVREVGLPETGLTRNWAQEFLCDLNTFRLYGPAAIAATAEMLAVAGGRSHEPSETHPPRWSRIQMMLGAFEMLDESPDDDVLRPWRGLAAEISPMDDRTVLCLRKFSEGLPVLWREVAEWGDRYHAESRRTAIYWLSERLKDGVPGGLAVEHQPDPGQEFGAPDVINAAWKALLAEPTHDEPQPPPLDNLALKALDNLEFAWLWRQGLTRARSSGVRPEMDEHPRSLYWNDSEDVVHLSDEDSRTGAATAIGLLARDEMVSRLAPHRDESRQLLVTPLLQGAVREAGIDVRLSSSFIVFRHSATEVFDAIRGDQDPREMQESVEKEWGEKFILHPGELVLASTLEYVVLPPDLVGHLITRSSYGRLGLITATAIQVQPGSKGCITLELVNLGQTPLALRAGERIGQLVLHTVTSSCELRSHTYRHPVGPEFSRVRDDWDRDVIRGIEDLLGLTNGNKRSSVSAYDSQLMDQVPPSV